MINLIKKKRIKYPPKKLMLKVGGADFKKVSDEFFKYFTDIVKVSPEDTILDVGCGVGRMAIPFIDFLTSGSYYGLDIKKELIEWRRENISNKNLNFNFELANIHNEAYNPDGVISAHEYKFSYRSQMFDFLFLTSVFTHVQTKELENYTGEIARVLKSGGKFLITFFLLNDESNTSIKNGTAEFTLTKKVDENSYRRADASAESCIGFKQTYIENLFQNNGLKIKEIKYGSWSRTNEFLSFQDIVIGEKI